MISRPILPVTLAGLSLLVAPAVADAAPPPPDAMPLSQIIQALEQQGDVAHFKEIDWDDDGYWDIEYVTVNGDEREIEVDPVTGQPRN